jgi:hypothetical protein
MLSAATARITVHPIHVGREPVTRHEGHALFNLFQHGVQLRVPRAHAQGHLPALLAHGGGEREVVPIDVEPLREGERLPAVNGVLGAWTEVAPSLDFGFTPLVASPVGVPTIVVSARVVCDLLNLCVALVHVELSTTTQAWKALRIAIVVSVLSLVRKGISTK